MLRLAALSALAAAIVVPQVLLAAYALSDPSTRALILDRPLMTAELVIAMAFWIGLFAWPLRRLYDRAGSRRKVEISRMIVAVRDQKFARSQTWMAPLASYTGLRHGVRTSLSGTRHELVLDHPEASKSVLLMVSEHIGDAEIAHFTRLLGLQHIKSGVGKTATKRGIGAPGGTRTDTLAEAA
jgi:hypothetical protein